MKIIQVDNFGNEARADVLIAENIPRGQFGNVMVRALNFHLSGENAPHYYRLVEDDHKLWRGMKELV